DPGAVAAPDEVPLVVPARGQPLRLDRLGTVGDRHRPDVRVVLGVEPALVVEAIDGARDDARLVPLVLVLLLLLDFDLLRVLTFRGLPFREVFVARLAREGDRLAVGRPQRRAGAPGQVGEPPGFPAGHRQQVDLGLVFLARGPREGEHPAVGRPARRRVARTRGQPPRRGGAGRRDLPETRVVTVLALV